LQKEVRVRSSGVSKGALAPDSLNENMPSNIIAVMDDLFFASKIRGTAAELGVTVSFARDIDVLIEAARRDRPSLIICDLHSRKIDPTDLAKQLKAEEELRTIPLVGFFSHVHTELQRQAESAGFDQVLPRSAFSKNLGEILSGKEIV
jgi:CheY-like chemotaxis protein